ncbi:MAG: ATP-binding cassette domain-containing protein, partial [Actinobacteria bacterium]|nr:ATP-binding cassette domain-containing protein [Actinomycetota bacterium]
MKSIVIRNLTKKIGNHIILENVTLDIEEGEFFCIMGPNGSGKTTLASIIATIKKPSTGYIEIFNKKPEEVKNLIGYVPQENFSVPILSGRENLIYFARIMGYSKNSA